MKCFYHSADLDGHCSGAIVKHKYPDCEMIGINYGQEFPWETIEPGEKVFMVDFCLQPFSDMQRLNEICKLYWIDHHKTAIDASRECDFMASGDQFLSSEKAGCELTWWYIMECQATSSVFLLGRYDVWDHAADKDVLNFQYGMRMYTDTRPDNQTLWKMIFYGDARNVAAIGKTILDYEQNQNAKFCNAYAFETMLNGMVAICANRGFTNSKVFDSVYNPAKHHLMITFCRLKPPAGKWTVSLYSTREDVDCGAIAKAFGGGGHKGAAGFQCQKLPFKH